MADNSEQERDVRQEIVDLINQATQARQNELNVSNALVESIKEALGITSGRNAADAGLLNVNREINRSILNQKEGLTEISDLQKVISKNEDTINKAKRVTNSLATDLTNTEKSQLNNVRNNVNVRDEINKKLEEQIKKVEAGEAGAAKQLQTLIDKAAVQDEIVAQEIARLNPAQQQVLLTEMNAKALEKQNAERNKELQLAEAIKSAEGLTGKAVGTIGKLLGINSDVQNKIKQDAKERLQTLQKEGKLMDGYQGKLQGISAYAKSLGTNLKKALTDPAAILTAMGTALLKNSQLTNQFQSELGVGYGNALAMRNALNNAAASSGDLFINSEKLQKSFFALKETTGVFFDISSQSAETFTNLTERIGLAGQEAGNLTMLMRLQGKETEANLENLYDTTGAMLQTSKTTASVKDILGDVAKSSKGLQASLASNPQALAKAAIAARELGATLADMEKVQGALLDFEQSIGAELEAELLTGKQLNLEKARLAALNNDMVALGEELKKQNVDLASFGDMNVKQQEAIAKAMGMNRNEMGEMLLKQEMQNKSLDEIRSTMGEQAYEQAKALSAQDKFNAGVAKLKDLFGSVMTALTPIIDLVAMLIQPIAFVAKLLGKLNELTGGFSNALIGVAIAAKALGANFGNVGSMIKAAFKKDTYTGFFSGIQDKLKGMSSPLKTIGDKFKSVFGGAADASKGIQFDPRMAGGGRFRDMASGRMVSEEAANAAGVFKPGTGPTAAAAAGATDAAGATGATPAPADNGETLKEKMKNIAEGIKAFANTDVIKGALSMIVAAPGLIALGVASLPLKITEKINGKAIEAAMKGIARGVAAFANPKALLGGLALIPVSLALATMAVGAIGLGAIALLGAPAAAGMFALTAGLTALGTAAATGVPFLGVGLIAAFGAALIPFGAALALAAPAIEAVGTVIATTISAIADAVVTVLPALTQSLIDLATQIPIANLLALALSLPSLAFGVGLLGGALLLSAPGFLLGSVTLPIIAPALAQLGEAISNIDAGQFLAFSIGMGVLSGSLVLLGALAPLVLVGTAALYLLNPALSALGEAVSNIPTDQLVPLSLGLLAVGGSLAAIGLFAPLAIAGAFAIGALGIALMPMAAMSEGISMVADAFVRVAESIQAMDISKIAALSIAVAGLSLSLAGLLALGPLALGAIAVVGGAAAIGGAAAGGASPISSVATGGASSVGGGTQSPMGGASVAAAEAGGITGEEVKSIVEETVTATINSLVPEMVAALKEGQGKIKVTNDNFNNSRQSEGPSRNRNIVNNNFA